MSVVLPASGWLMMAKVRRRVASAAGSFTRKGYRRVPAGPVSPRQRNAARTWSRNSRSSSDRSESAVATAWQRSGHLAAKLRGVDPTGDLGQQRSLAVLCRDGVPDACHGRTDRLDDVEGVGVPVGVGVLEVVDGLELGLAQHAVGEGGEDEELDRGAVLVVVFGQHNRARAEGWTRFSIVLRSTRRWR